MFLNEEEKEEIKKKYEGNYSQELLNHLKRNFPIYEFELKWMETPIKQILVDEKLYNLAQNKKYLVNKISNVVEEVFPTLDKPTLRRTVKYYLDILK